MSFYEVQAWSFKDLALDLETPVLEDPIPGVEH